MNIKEKLYQKFWFRNFFENKTFYKSDGKWYDYKDYQKEHKIDKVAGKYNTLIYCDCGNELTHSHSFIDSFFTKNKEFLIWEYICSSCKKHQFWNPDIAGMAIIECDDNGIPLKK